MNKSKHSKFGCFCGAMGGVNCVVMTMWGIQVKCPVGWGDCEGSWKNQETSYEIIKVKI